MFEVERKQRWKVGKIVCLLKKKTRQNDEIYVMRFEKKSKKLKITELPNVMKIIFKVNFFLVNTLNPTLLH